MHMHMHVHVHMHMHMQHTLRMHMQHALRVHMQHALRMHCACTACSLKMPRRSPPPVSTMPPSGGSACATPSPSRQTRASCFRSQPMLRKTEVGGSALG